MSTPTPEPKEFEFTVTWEIQVSAPTHEEAARKAKAMRTAPDTTADVYEVHHPMPGVESRVIDLSELDNPERIPWDAPTGN